MAFVSLPSVSHSQSFFTDKYDASIKQAALTFLPSVPWKMWKAQLYQESRLDPAAVSPVGAAGIAQFMPATWNQIAAEMKLGAIDRHAAEPAILAGAYYMAKLRRGWKSPRPEDDRHKLAQASYNAGFGSLLAAQTACGGKALYDEIIVCLPQITGKKNANETTTYVSRIRRWWMMLEAGV